MKATTITISQKGQTLMPLDWRKQNDLAQGGSCNVFYLKEGGLLVLPVKPPGPRALKRLLAQVKAVKPPADWKQRVQRALDDTRR